LPLRQLNGSNSVRQLIGSNFFSILQKSTNYPKFLRKLLPAFFKNSSRQFIGSKNARQFNGSNFLKSRSILNSFVIVAGIFLCPFRFPNPDGMKLPVLALEKSNHLERHTGFRLLDPEESV